MRKAFSVTVALITLMVCTTLVVSEVSAAPVGTVGITAKPMPPNFFTMLHQFIMNFMHLWFCHVPTPPPSGPVV